MMVVASKFDASLIWVAFAVYYYLLDKGSFKSLNIWNIMGMIGVLNHLQLECIHGLKRMEKS